MYSVEICRDADETVQAYMNGCEQRFASLEEAEGYLSTFEEFEQEMLCIRLLEERCERETLEEQCYRECKASYEELKRSWS